MPTTEAIQQTLPLANETLPEVSNLGFYVLYDDRSPLRIDHVEAVLGGEFSDDHWEARFIIGALHQVVEHLCYQNHRTHSEPVGHIALKTCATGIGIDANRKAPGYREVLRFNRKAPDAPITAQYRRTDRKTDFDIRSRDISKNSLFRHELPSWEWDYYEYGPKHNFWFAQELEAHAGKPVSIGNFGDSGLTGTEAGIDFTVGDTVIEMENYSGLGVGDKYYIKGGGRQKIVNANKLSAEDFPAGLGYDGRKLIAVRDALVQIYDELNA